MRPVTEQEQKVFSLILRKVFFLIKALTVGLAVLIAVLILSQSAVAPVSVRLLSTYALEYATKTIKPYRHFFPQPYMVNLEE